MRGKLSIRIILGLLFLFMFLQASFCQENYQPGYIVGLKGDTLHGFINYRNWERNPDKISFRKGAVLHPAGFFMGIAYLQEISEGTG